MVKREEEDEWLTNEPQKSCAVADRKFKAENRCPPPPDVPLSSL